MINASLNNGKYVIECMFLKFCNVSLDVRKYGDFVFLGLEKMGLIVWDAEREAGEMLILVCPFKGLDSCWEFLPAEQIVAIKRYSCVKPGYMYVVHRTIHFKRITLKPLIPILPHNPIPITLPQSHKTRKFLIYLLINNRRLIIWLQTTINIRFLLNTFLILIYNSITKVL